MIDTALLDMLTLNAQRDEVQQLVVGAVVHFDGKVLLLQRPTDDFMGGLWELPSGKVDPGETVDQALIREIKEETGLDITGVRGYLGEFDYQSGSGKKSRQFNFAVDVADPNPIQLTEHDAYTWITEQEDPPVSDAVREVLALYHQQWTSPR
ncbi:8-oxo-dGTP diphosphatase [Nocardia amikacinitolerans]|uniref:NUDIX domain-containing protein n=1 Tax=Nocardia amikacinitolerans TaxID=756689 RepID=UPI0020A31DAC|nr:NUDIX domain-containing protein [Nocardia amikacinitolerans]MCP2297588.1 8-oxo-dGTP diphosphatase [Nocardia amikacinitolerans]